MQQDLLDRLERLDRETELMKTVLIVKEPGSGLAANAFEGLRKQIIASAGERMSHLNQVVQMAVATNRATSVEDLRRMVEEWLNQSGIARLTSLPTNAVVSDLFESLDGSALPAAGPLEVLEPAYVDSQTGRVLRLGRARAAAGSTAELDPFAQSSAALAVDASTDADGPVSASEPDVVRVTAQGEEN